MANKFFSIENMSNELKIAYVLILVIIVILVTCCCGSCFRSGKTSDSGWGILRLIRGGNNHKSESVNEISQWIKDNPKEILDSVNNYMQQEQLKAQKEQQNNAKAAIKENYSKLIDSKNTGIYNKNGTKVIIEFFDYNCGYCKLAKKAIDEVVKSNKDVKVVFRDFPIFGGNSDLAARYAIAVAISNPSKYYDFATALFEIGADKESKIKDALKKAGIRADIIERTLKNKKDDIDQRLSENRELGNLLGLQGTPAFIIGEEFVPGYVDAATISNMLK